jgi:hypothetical protein
MPKEHETNDALSDAVNGGRARGVAVAAGDSIVSLRFVALLG